MTWIARPSLVLFVAVLVAVLIAAWAARRRRPSPRRDAEARRDEHLARQIAAVRRPGVLFRKRRVMGRGELDVFHAALSVVRQPLPGGPYPFHVFPQVSLGQIIGADPDQDTRADQAHADQAHRAINSKRCDLLITDRAGNPVAVVEYQGAGHDLGGTAERRDAIKRTALERAGVRVVEIAADADGAEMRRIIQAVLDQAQATRRPRGVPS